MWELVKWLGSVIELPINTSDATMPHVWSMVAVMGEPEVRGSETTVLQAVVMATFRSLILAAGGFIIGAGVGLLLAVIMQRFLFMERGLLPFVIASQTVPLIALASLEVASLARMADAPALKIVEMRAVGDDWRIIAVPQPAV